MNDRSIHGDLQDGARLDPVRIGDRGLVGFVDPGPFAVRVVEFLGYFLEGIVFFHRILDGMSVGLRGTCPGSALFWKGRLRLFSRMNVARRAGNIVNSTTGEPRSSVVLSF